MRISNPSDPRDRLLAAIFKASPDGMILVNYLEFDVVDVNPSFCELLGYVHDEIVGTSYYDLGLWVEPDQAETLLEQLQVEGGASLPKALVKHQSGEEISLQMLVRMVKIEGKDYVLATAHQLTSKPNEVQIENRWIEIRNLDPGIQGKIGQLGDELTSYVQLLKGLNEPFQKESALRQLQVLCATCVAQLDLLLVESSALNKTLETAKVATIEAQEVENSGSERILPFQVLELTTRITSFLTEIVKLIGI